MVGKEMNSQTPRAVLDMPEVNVAIYSFLLNFPWELWQVSFFREMASAPHWAATKFCTQASFGDAMISTVSFWAVAIMVQSRQWILRSSWRAVAGFVSIGVVITIVFEELATGPLDRWQYAEIMPTLPVIGTGLFPILQWVVIPPLIVWFVRRQLT